MFDVEGEVIFAKYDFSSDVIQILFIFHNFLSYQ